MSIKKFELSLKDLQFNKVMKGDNNLNDMLLKFHFLKLLKVIIIGIQTNYNY